MRNNGSVVVLNRYGLYWAETTLKRAVRKIINERAVTVKSTNKLLGRRVMKDINGNKEYEPIYRPLIIRLLYFDNYKYKSDDVPYSDRQVFIRDRNECQYWHDYDLVKNEEGKYIHVKTERHIYTVPANERTIDHVIPISQNGPKSDYTNVVCCCRYCNEIIKKNQTPKEAGMVLRRKPLPPRRRKGDIASNAFLYNKGTASHEAYIAYCKECGMEA